jgi:AhpD family alkylhydroperoxidase
MPPSNHPTHAFVRKAYGRIAARGQSAPGGCCGPQSSCCGGDRASEIAQGLGYSDAELATLPEGANLGLSCGNPTALADLKPGEIVLDLGSGAGLDVFLAAQRVGPTGRAIGVDMTPEMLAKASGNAETFRERTGLDNVVFHQGQIEAIPLADACVDVVLSNCVLNLSPDQPQVWKEIARVLKPGGRVAISDMVLLRPLPEKLRESVEALVGCIAGAPLLEDLRSMIQAAGLVDVRLTPKPGSVAAMLQGDDPNTRELLALLPERTQPEDFIASYLIAAAKADQASPAPLPSPKGLAVAQVQVFDPAMCCPTGVCGPAVDPKLVRFSADLDWLKTQGVAVERFNLSQQAMAFAEDAEVKAALQAQGEGALPLIKVDGKVQSLGAYPSRDQLATWAGLGAAAPSLYTEAIQELVAIGAAIASNCESCFKFHYDKARKLGVSKEDMVRAVQTAQGVKDAPARAIRGLAERYLGPAPAEALATPASEPLPTAPATGCCSGEPDTGCCS